MLKSKAINLPANANDLMRCYLARTLIWLINNTVFGTLSICVYRKMILTLDYHYCKIDLSQQRTRTSIVHI